MCWVKEWSHQEQKYSGKVQMPVKSSSSSFLQSICTSLFPCTLRKTSAAAVSLLHTILKVWFSPAGKYFLNLSRCYPHDISLVFLHSAVSVPEVPDTLCHKELLFGWGPPGYLLSLNSTASSQTSPPCLQMVWIKENSHQLEPNVFDI